MGGTNEPVAKPLLPILPLWDASARPSQKTLLQYPIMLRHEWFTMMYEHSRVEFDKFVGAPRKSPTSGRTWKKNSGLLEGHPI